MAHAENYLRAEKKVRYTCNGTKLGNNDVKGAVILVKFLYLWERENLLGR